MQRYYAPNSTRCPRCGLPLQRVGVACERRSCRPAALRITHLCSFGKDTDPKFSVLGTMNGKEHIVEPVEPIAPLGIAIPSLEQ